MDDLLNLQKLSVVATITTLLSEKLGITDKTVSEYIIHLAKSSKNLQDFSAQLQDTGVEFSELIVKQLFSIICNEKPRNRSRSTHKLAKGDIIEVVVKSVLKSSIIVVLDNGLEVEVSGSVEAERGDKLRAKVFDEDSLELKIISNKTESSNPYYSAPKSYGELTGIKLDTDSAIKPRISSPEL
jgi:hypothetical protein